MMVNNEGGVRGLLRWQQDKAVHYLVAGLVAYVVHDGLGQTWLAFPSLPVSVVGAAIGIFVSFRTNAAYDRWWEGRKLWGRVINSSRHWTHQVLAYIAPHDPELARALVLRHVAWVHTLRCLLRQQDPMLDADTLPLLDDQEREAFPSTQTPTALLLHRQTQGVTSAAAAGYLSELRLQSLDRTLMDLLDEQGGCERIKGTPLPRGYAFITDILVQYYAWILPFAMVEHMGILTIPLNLFVCMSFLLISETGRVLEDPFTMFWNGLPLHNLSRKIERDARQRLGDTELPDAIVPDANGILW